MNCGCGSSVGGSGGAMAMISSVTILGVSLLGLPLPLAFTFLPPFESCWK